MSNNASHSWPHSKLIGAEFVSFDKDTSIVTMNYTAPEVFITPRGSVQGGLVAGFLDDAMSWAHTYSTNGDFSPLMLDVNYTLLRPVLQGALVGKGRVIKAGKRVLFLSAELLDTEGNILARGTSTCIPTANPGIDLTVPE